MLLPIASIGLAFYDFHYWPLTKAIHLVIFVLDALSFCPQIFSSDASQLALCYLLLVFRFALVVLLSSQELSIFISLLLHY